MGAHYTYLEHFIPSTDSSGELLAEPALEIAQSTQKFVFALIVGVLMIIIGKLFATRLRTPEQVERAIIPPRRGGMWSSAFAFIDLCIEAFVKYHDGVLGKAKRKYIPFVASIFFFILILNVLSLIPGIPSSISIQPTPERYTAGSDTQIQLTAKVLDQHGNPTAGALDASRLQIVADRRSAIGSRCRTGNFGTGHTKGHGDCLADSAAGTGHQRCFACQTLSHY